MIVLLTLLTLLLPVVVVVIVIITVKLMKERKRKKQDICVCPKCGQPVAKEKNFCTNCGEKVK